MRSCVEKDCLPIALQADVECVNDDAVALGTGRDQRLPTLGWIDDIQHRVLRVRRFLIAEIHTGRQADVDAPRREPNVDVRSHRLSALAANDASRLDCADGVNARRKICPRSRPSTKSLIEWLVLVFGGVIVPAGGGGFAGLGEARLPWGP